MSCNCSCNGNNCGLPTQPNYNNLDKGFIAPKEDCYDCDNILKNNIRPIINHYIVYKYDEEGNSICPTIDIYPNTFNFIRFDEYVDELEIILTDIRAVCDNYNYEYKLHIVCEYDGISIIFDKSIYWANDEAPDFESGYDYEISISQNAGGYWCGCWVKYLY